MISSNKHTATKAATNLQIEEVYYLQKKKPLPSIQIENRKKNVPNSEIHNMQRNT